MLPNKRKKNERPGLVYALGTLDGSFIKLGHTDKGVRARMARARTCLVPPAR